MGLSSSLHGQLQGDIIDALKLICLIPKIKAGPSLWKKTSSWLQKQLPDYIN